MSKEEKPNANTNKATMLGAMMLYFCIHINIQPHSIRKLPSQKLESCQKQILLTIKYVPTKSKKVENHNSLTNGSINSPIYKNIKITLIVFRNFAIFNFCCL